GAAAARRCRLLLHRRPMVAWRLSTGADVRVTDHAAGGVHVVGGPGAATSYGLERRSAAAVVDDAAAAARAVVRRRAGAAVRVAERRPRRLRRRLHPRRA